MRGVQPAEGCMWDPSSGNRRPCDDGDSLASYKRARTAAGGGDTTTAAYDTTSYDTLMAMRHTDLTPLQWLDTSKTSRVWPDPPIAGRALTIEAYMGLQVGDQWTYDVGTSVESDRTIELSEVDEGDPLGFTGLVLGASTTGASNYRGFYLPWYGVMPEFPRRSITPFRHEFPSKMVAGGGVSLRSIYEPHFISTPNGNGITFLREGLECSAVMVENPHTLDGIFGGWGGQSGPGWSQPDNLDRYSTKNTRAEDRDFGISHTLKVPTGGMGGNPFWLKDTVNWPDILASLHFDFLPFQVPRTPTRPITYRFWDSLYSTALFGGPTFSIVLDDYGIFDEEYYRMVLRHYNQNEMQIHQWRKDQGLPFNAKAGLPQHYINPHRWWLQGYRDHPFPDTTAGGFLGGEFRMDEWRGLCAELCFSPVPDGLTWIDPVSRPYGDSKETLSMGEKRKVHDQSNFAANPNAIQDYYYTFVLGPTAAAADVGTDLFDYADEIEEDFAVTPYMLSHRVIGEKACDTPFAYGGRIKRLMDSSVSQANEKERKQTMSQLFAPNVDDSDPAITALYPAITGSSNRFLVDKLTAIQQWAWEKIYNFGKEKVEQGINSVAALIEKNFPKLGAAVRKALTTLLESAEGVNPFQTGKALFDDIGAKAASAIKDMIKSIAGAEGVSDEVLLHAQGIAGSIFSRSPIAGDVEMKTFADYSAANAETKMPAAIEATANIGGVEGAEALEGAANAAEASAAAGEAVAAEAGEAAVAVAGESVMAAVVGPLALALAVTFALQAWERAAEQAAKDEAAKEAKAIVWAEWDGLRIPFDIAYLGGDAAYLAHITALAPTISRRTASDSDSIARIQAMYMQGTEGGVADVTLAFAESISGDDYDMAQINDMKAGGILGFGATDPWVKCGELADNAAGDEESRGSLGWNTMFDKCLANNQWNNGGYKATSARYFNWDPTALDDGKPAFVGGDLRTVANLIGMNHLTLSCVNMAFFPSDTTDTMKIRARELLQMAEIMRTMRVVDYYMRASTWAATDDTTWRPFPPVKGIPASLLKDHMTPIPAVTAFDLDLAQLWQVTPKFQSTMETLRAKGKEGVTAYLDAIEGRTTVVDDQFMAGAWNTYVERIADKYGVAPKYEFVESSDPITLADGTTTMVATVLREIPVPIFAPGRSPTMFVSSMDPTMAWPTKAMKGVMMSNFNDETRYFTDHGINPTPESDSLDPQQSIESWFRGKAHGATFGGIHSRFILSFDPDPAATGVYTIHNESTVPIMLVDIDSETDGESVVGIPESVAPNSTYVVTDNVGIATYFITMASLYPGVGPIDQSDAYHEWLVDWTKNLAPSYRSNKFVANLNGTKTGPGGTFTVLDHNQLYANVMLFEDRMMNRVAPLMVANAACYEALAYFWATDYALMKALSGAKLDDICAWLLDAIPEPAKNGAGAPTVMPQDYDRQVMLHVMAHEHFATDEALKTLKEKRAQWDTRYAEAPSVAEKGIFSREHDCNGPDATSYGHPKTTPEGGLVMTHALALDAQADESVTVAYGFEPDSDRLAGYLADVGVASDFGWIDDVPGAAAALGPVLAEVRAVAEDVLNNMADQFDAMSHFTDPDGDGWIVNGDPRLVASIGGLMAACEAVRIARIAATKKLQALVDSSTVLSVLDALPPASDGTAGAVQALRMMFDVRRNPGVSYEPHTTLSTFRGLHKLLAQVCKLTYKDDSLPTANRIHLVNPDTKESAFYVRDGGGHELASTLEIATYYVPMLSERDVLKKTLIVAFRGTDFGKDIASKYPDQKTNLFQKIAAVVTPYSDLYSDVSILLGTQAESDRFKSSEAYCDLIITNYKSCFVLLTGHSLGGSLAMHCLQYMVSKGATNVRAVVFNPGKGLDKAYFDTVEEEIKSPKPTQWYNALTTYRVGGESSWPLDDDPVSLFSGGLGTTLLIEGPGVPKSLKAHSSDNFVTTAVHTSDKTPVMPNRG